MELALAGVAEQRGGDLVALQHVLHPHQEIGQHLGRRRPCLRRRAPAGWAPSPDTAPAAPCRPAARTRSVSSSSNACRAPKASRFCCHISSTSRCSRSRTSSGSSPSCSTSSTASVSGGISRSKRGSASRARLRWRRSIRSQAVGLLGQDVGHRPGRLLQAVEQQQRHAAMTRQRLGGQRGLGDQRQRAFRAGQQPGQVEVVRRRARRPGRIRSGSAGTSAGCRRISSALSRQQVGQPVDQLALPRDGAGAHAVGQRLAAELQHLAVGQHDLQAAHVAAASSRTSASGCRRRRWRSCCRRW